MELAYYGSKAVAINDTPLFAFLGALPGEKIFTSTNMSYEHT